MRLSSNSEDLHVVPVNDLREHVLCRSCWCHPTVDTDGGEDVVIHNALDQREKYEYGELRMH